MVHLIYESDTLAFSIVKGPALIYIWKLQSPWDVWLLSQFKVR